jgi:hypothetical protein
MLLFLLNHGLNALEILPLLLVIGIAMIVVVFSTLFTLISYLTGDRKKGSLTLFILGALTLATGFFVLSMDLDSVKFAGGLVVALGMISVLAALFGRSTKKEV